MRTAVALALAFTLAAPTLATAQTFPTDDSVIQRMWQVGIESSQTEELAHHLMDYIGPRLAGSLGLAAAQDWLLGLYAEWGIPVRKEQYGTVNGWREGITHVDMISPWVRTLEAKQQGWSPPSGGPVEGEVLSLFAMAMEADPSEWLPMVKDKWVMLSFPEPTCRARQQLERWARPGTVARLDSLRRERASAWRQWISGVGHRIFGRMQEEGALGFIGSRWTGGWGVFALNSSLTNSIPSVEVSCEDYSLLNRLAESGKAPRIRVETESENLGVVPQLNVVAEIKGTELPDEYVLLGAHLDSWHGGTGATDNGTGTIMMLEAMRILKETYPNPRRTILVGHWGVEERGGFPGSGSFREDHPEVMEGMQAAFNHDNGTWRIIELEGQGFADAENHIPNWMAAVPTEISEHVDTPVPGEQLHGASDHDSFICAGVPSFRLRSSYPEYRQYTWHTNRDTYDKIVFDDLAENATLAAMLAYMASEDPVRFGRERAELPVSERTGEPRSWLQCHQPRREPR
jgi:hypothetical protein